MIAQKAALAAVPALFSIASLCLVCAGAGLSYGLYRSRRLRAARAYSFALASFALFALDGLFRELAALAAGAAPLLRAAAAFSVAAAGPLELAFGGRFWAAALGLSRARTWTRAHDALAALLACLSAAYLLLPGSAFPALAARFLFFSVLAVWIAAVAAKGRGSPVLSGGAAGMRVLFLPFAAAFLFVVADSFFGALLGPADGLSVPLFSAALGLAAFRFPVGAFDRPSSLRGGALTPDFVAAYGLSPREAEVAAAAASGASAAALADALCISVRTVENHLASIYRKTGARGRVQLVQLLLSGQADASDPRSAN